MKRAYPFGELIGTSMTSFNGGNNQIITDIMGNIGVRNEFGANMGNEFINQGSITSAASKKMRYFKNDTGPTFGSMVGRQDEFLNSFKAQAKANINAMNYPQTKRRVNPSIRVRRMVKRLEPKFEAVSSYEFGILYSLPKYKTNSSGVVINRDYEYQDRGTMNYREIVEDDILPIMNIATWNYSRAKSQYKTYQNDPQQYFSLNADEIWKDCSFDGVVMGESAVSGLETSVSGGMRTNINGQYTLAGDGSKLLTMVAKGQVKVYNIFGNSVRQGSSLFAIIKKFHAVRNFILNPRIPDSKNGPNIKNCDFKLNFKPFQIALISLPYDSYVPMEYLRYTDENGRVGYGKAIKLGTVLHKPSFIQTEDPPTPDRLYPHTNASEGSTRQSNNDFVEIILNPNNGYLPL